MTNNTPESELKAELLSCPFCKSAIIEFTAFDDGWKFAGMCSNCKTRGPVYRTRQAAVDAWNTRPVESGGDK